MNGRVLFLEKVLINDEWQTFPGMELNSGKWMVKIQTGGIDKKGRQAG